MLQIGITSGCKFSPGCCSELDGLQKVVAGWKGLDVAIPDRKLGCTAQADNSGEFQLAGAVSSGNVDCGSNIPGSNDNYPDLYM